MISIQMINWNHICELGQGKAKTETKNGNKKRKQKQEQEQEQEQREGQKNREEWKWKRKTLWPTQLLRTTNKNWNDLAVSYQAALQLV